MSFLFFNGVANFAIATKSLLSLYKPIVVIYGVNDEPVEKLFK